MLWSLLFILLIAPGTLSSCGNGQCLECDKLASCTEALFNSQKEALNGTTSQSSDYVAKDGTRYGSGRALDGNMSTCAHTLEFKKSWWTIDLLGVYTISNITIYNTCTPVTNIAGAQIFIGNSLKNNGTTNQNCTTIAGFKSGGCNDISCEAAISGRYVTVFREEESYVVLCEVRINGQKKESPFQLIKKNKTWEEALEYCRGNDMDLASILDEETQAFAELEARNANTPFVWLGLRYTCTLGFWFWVADHRLEFSNWAPGHKTENCDMSAAMSKAEGHQWSSKPDQRRFNFICERC